MKYIEVKKELLEIIKSHKGWFVSSYQVCEELKDAYPLLWDKIKNEYPSTSTDVEVGTGTGRHYSPASFVANALAHFARNEKKLAQEYFSCANVQFGDVIPGFTGNVLGIWAWKE